MSVHIHIRVSDAFVKEKRVYFYKLDHRIWAPQWHAEQLPTMFQSESSTGATASSACKPSNAARETVACMLAHIFNVCHCAPLHPECEQSLLGNAEYFSAPACSICLRRCKLWLNLLGACLQPSLHRMCQSRFMTKSTLAHRHQHKAPAPII